MKKLMSSQRPGLAIIEVILVMTISALLFGVVIGTFATRRKAASDDAARQVMSEIAKVRNQAQQGQGASTGTIPPGNEMFGQAIILAPNSSDITVYKLMQSRTDSSISSYENYTIKMPNSLKWFIAAGSSGTYCDAFTSCYGSPLAYLGATPPFLDGTTNTRILLVFRNNTGQSYAFAAPTSGIGTDASSITNYTTTPSRQLALRLAFGIPGSVGTDLAKFDAGTSKYYANFDLAIPNNQDLQVFK